MSDEIDLEYTPVETRPPTLAALHAERDRLRGLLAYVARQACADLLHAGVSDRTMVKVYLPAGKLREIAAAGRETGQ